MVTFQNFQNLKIENPRQQFDSTVYPQHPVENHLVLYAPHMRDNVSRKPLFLPKNRKNDVTLTSYVVDVSEVSSFRFVRMCQIDGLDGIENLVMILL